VPVSRCNSTSAAGSASAGGNPERFSRQPPRPILPGKGLIDRGAGQAVREAVPADPCLQQQAKAALLADGALGHGRDTRGSRGVITSPGDTPVLNEYWRAQRLGIVRRQQEPLDE
jgi:hypothetical protein